MTWPLGDRPILVSESVTVIFVEPEVFYSVPEDMKSMKSVDSGQAPGLATSEHPSPNNDADPVPMCGWVNPAAFWDHGELGSLISNL